MPRNNVLIAASYVSIFACRLGLARRPGEMIGRSEVEKEATPLGASANGKVQEWAAIRPSLPAIQGFCGSVVALSKTIRRPADPGDSL